MKKYIKEIVALTLGLICGFIMFVLNSESMKEIVPIVISLKSSTNNVQLYYTTDENQPFNNEQVCNISHISGDDYEFVLNTEYIHKVRFSFASCPGPTILKDITVIGEKSVKITNFENPEKNDIDEYFSNNELFAINSSKPNPFITLQTPFDIKANVIHTKLFIESLIVFIIASFVFYCFICIIIRITKRDHSDFKHIFITSMLLIAGFLSCITAKILSEKVSPYRDKNISISAKMKIENPFIFSYFYTDKPNMEFSHQQMVNKPLPSGENEFTIQLPITHLEKLRIDFGQNPGAVDIERITIHGNEDIVIKGDEFNKSVKWELEDIKTNNGIFHLKSTGGDPWLAFVDSFNIDGAKIFNIDTTIFFTLFFTLLGFFTIGIIVTSKHVEGKRAEDLALVIIFLSLCIAPTFLLTDKKVSVKEKRKLAEFPAMSDSTGFNSNFSTQFDTWYSDHFAKRYEIVSLHNTILQSKGDAQNENVIEGKDGWFFYKLDNNIDNYANLQIISNEDLVSIKNYLLTINNWCNAHGKKFYFLICPNKATIYGDKVKYIKKIQSDENSDAIRLTNFLNANGIKTVFSKDEIIKHKNDGHLLYFKQDTHHNEFGAYYSYKAIMDVISKDFPLTTIPLSNISITDYKALHGFDLKGMMPGAIKDDTCTYQHLDVKGANITSIETNFQNTSTNPQGTFGLYVLGDSYSILLQKFLNSNFQTVNLNRGSQYWFSNEELDKIEATSNVVLLEVVERHLSILSNQKVDTKMQPYAPLQVNAK